MELYMYAYRNSEGDFYAQPFVSGDDPSIATEKFARMMYAADDKQLESLSVDELYLIGIFEDTTGVVTPKKEFILNMGSIARSVLSQRAMKGNADGKQENCIKEEEN